MAPKKENTGGKKFQGRLDGEKRVKVIKKTAEKKPYKSRKFEGSGPGEKKFTDRKPKSGQDFETGFKRKERDFGDKPFAKRKDASGRFSSDKEKPDKRSFSKAPVGKKYFKDEKADKRDTPQNFKGRGKSYRQGSKKLEKGSALFTEELRLNRYIANSGLCSRREADTMIEQGLVVVNGVPVTTLGVKVKPGDDVRVDGKRINPESPVYIVLNKPKGYITSTADPEGRATVMDLIDLPGKERIYPVGRLDRNTTGVLLLTNDGELAQKLMHPSFEIRKIYKARLDRKPSKEHMLAWVNGVELEDGFMSFEQVGFVDEEDQTVLGLEVHSGRNRIVRRMFEHFDYEVVSLDRVMLGDFDHIRLGRGKWRFLSEKEVEYVERLKRMKPKKPSRK